MSNTINYKARIYADYASTMQDAGDVFDKQAAVKWGAAYRHYLRDWLPSEKSADIADLACGGGRLLYFFKELGYANLHGVDVSPSQVRLAQQVVPDVQEGNLFDYLRAHKESFDLITGIDIIEHLTKDEVLEFLDTCHCALRPGGRLVIQTPNAESPWGSALRYADFTHLVSFTPECLQRLLALCAFENATAREMGPPASGSSRGATFRFLLWRGVRFVLQLWNRIETGMPGSGIFTRVFIASATKKETA